MGTSSVDDELLLFLSWNRFLCIQCPKISFFYSRMVKTLGYIFCLVKKSLHTLQPGANVCTFLTTSYLILKLIVLFFNFQTLSLSVVEVILCSNLKDDLCKLNLVLNSFSVSPIYVSLLFEAASVFVDL